MQNQQLPSTIGNGINVFLSVSVTVVVGGKLLYTTTTNGLRLQLCFVLGGWIWALGWLCKPPQAAPTRQNETNIEKGRSLLADAPPLFKAAK
jgi:hypothetical protein